MLPISRAKSEQASPCAGARERRFWGISELAARETQRRWGMRWGIRWGIRTQRARL